MGVQSLQHGFITNILEAQYIKSCWKMWTKHMMKYFGVIHKLRWQDEVGRWYVLEKSSVNAMQVFPYLDKEILLQMSTVGG